MMNSIKLFQFTNENIKVDIEARFEGEILIIDGYDIGKTTADYWGDSDYEYNTKVFQEGVEKLYGYFGVWPNDQQGLLQALAAKFNTNACYSDFQNLLDNLKIQYETWSWT
jgi:hypothetical protein